MKHLQYALFLICLFFSLNLKAQQNHFIYIQTDNKQAFYVKLDKMVYSSTTSGYIVIPKLKTGSYSFVIGFPKNEWPEQNIRCSVEDKDLGYLLKNFGDKGWGLFNLQSLTVLMAEDTGKKGIAVDLKSDAFSNMLSLVVNDSTIKQNEEAKEEIKKPVVEIAKKEDTPIVENPVKDKVIETPKPEIMTTQVLIAKKLTKKTADGVEMVYIDTEGGIQDTVNIFIPDKEIVDTALVKPSKAIKVKETKPKETESVALPSEEKQKDSKFLEMELPNPNTTVKEAKSDTAVQQGISVSSITNADCKSFATNDDFLKLRKKMAAADNPEDMISLAKKVFKSKCFATEQVKNLSVLFLKDAGKYDFFDAVYPFVSDSKNFETLESQLTDSYYIKRFKVMIKN
jgi:hypothetical protein